MSTTLTPAPCAYPGCDRRTASPDAHPCPRGPSNYCADHCGNHDGDYDAPLIRAAYVTHNRQGQLLLPVRFMAADTVRATVARPDPWGYGCVTGSAFNWPVAVPLTQRPA